MHDRAVQKAAKYCSLTYVHMERFHATELVKAGRKLISQYTALEQETMEQDEDDTKTWRLKPKFHLFSHLLDEVAAGNHPRNTWSYRDENLLEPCRNCMQQRVAMQSLGRLRKNCCSSGCLKQTH